MPRSDLSTAAACSPSTASMVMARTRCGSASGLRRTVNPLIAPSAVSRSMRFCTVPRGGRGSLPATGHFREEARSAADQCRPSSPRQYANEIGQNVTFVTHFVNFASFSLGRSCGIVGLPSAGGFLGGEPIVPWNTLLLLTDPAHFGVTYTINPWMQPCAWAQDPVGHLAAARRSFQSLVSALTAAGARLEVMQGVAGLPDMVFPANAAVVLDHLALLARFRHPERQG